MPSWTWRQDCRGMKLARFSSSAPNSLESLWRELHKPFIIVLFNGQIILPRRHHPPGHFDLRF